MAPNPEDRLGGTDGLEFEPVVARPEPKRHWGRWVSFAVVVVVGAGGGWYYFGDQFSIMDKENTVPVIRAEITPVKIKPADPGGMEVPDRDKLVYDRLNGEGAGTNVERLLPPPETPKPIPDSQLQGSPSETNNTGLAALNAPEQPILSEPAPDQQNSSQAMVPESATPEPQEEMAAAATPIPPADANAPVPLQPSSDISSAVNTATQDAPTAPPPPPAPVVPVETAPASPTPLQPAVAEPLQSAAQETTSTQTPSATVQPTANSTVTAALTATATPATTDYRIQLAALRTHERAETEWKRQKKAHPDILGALQLFVVRVDLGGDKGVFYRLRAGPLKDRATAKTLCGELAKRNVGCLVIRPGK